MNIKPIKTEADYKRVLKRIDKIMDAELNTPKGDELDILATLVEKYEKEHYPISDPDPIEAIKFRMDQMGYTQKDLAKALGLKSRASEILNRKRKLTLAMIRKLHTTLNIPAEILVKAY